MSTRHLDHIDRLEALTERAMRTAIDHEGPRKVRAIHWIATLNRARSGAIMDSATEEAEDKARNQADRMRSDTHLRLKHELSELMESLELEPTPYRAKFMRERVRRFQQWNENILGPDRSR